MTNAGTNSKECAGAFAAAAPQEAAAGVAGTVLVAVPCRDHDRNQLQPDQGGRTLRWFP